MVTVMTPLKLKRLERPHLLKKVVTVGDTQRGATSELLSIVGRGVTLGVRGARVKHDSSDQGAG